MRTARAGTEAGANGGANVGAEVGAGLTWRLIHDGALPGARNMALDHALARCLTERTATLRLYGWSRPTVSFGRNEPAATSYDRHAGLARGFQFVRRPTGGRAVLHDFELTYAVVVPLRALGGPRQAYRLVNGCLAGALRELGAAARVTRGGPALRPDRGPCFGAAAPGEVVVDGRKRIGSAQARIGPALLQHGSILLGTDQDELLALMPGATSDAGERRVLSSTAGSGATQGGRGATPTGTLEERTPAAAGPGVPAMSIDEVARAVAMSVVGTLGGEVEGTGYEAHELDEADRLEAETYGRPSWTWRR